MSRTNHFATARDQFNRVHHRLGSSPLILWFLGVLSLSTVGIGIRCANSNERIPRTRQSNRVAGSHGLSCFSPTS